MKASLKFREERMPLLRAKVPLNILGLPFQSGIVAGESKELTLNLATFFNSGPSVKFAYRPNDSWNPFSLIVKTGTGPFGSPFSASMIMSAEFNLVARGNGNPIFMLHFKPRFGDFSFKKSQSSVFDKNMKMLKPQKGVSSDDDSSTEVVDSPVMKSSYGNSISALNTDSPAASAITNIFSGMEVAARTKLPIRSRTVVHFRWGVRVPVELKSSADATVGIGFQNFPFLMMDKIAIEHVDSGDSKGRVATKRGSGLALSANAEVAEAFFTMKRQLAILQAENGLLRNAVEDLRREVAEVRILGRPDSGNYREFERNGAKTSSGKNDRRNSEKKPSDFSSFPTRSAGADVNQELKKTLK